MPKPRGDVEIWWCWDLITILRAFVKLNWWDVYWVNEFVGGWVWIFRLGRCRVRRKMCLQEWYLICCYVIAGVVSYILLCDCRYGILYAPMWLQVWYLICCYVIAGVVSYMLLCDCRCGILYAPMWLQVWYLICCYVIAGVVSYMLLCDRRCGILYAAMWLQGWYLICSYVGGAGGCGIG